MKKTMRRTLACMTVLGACLFLATALAAGTVNTIMDAVLRASPSYLGKVVETLRSGTSVELMSEEGEWARVNAGGQQGWLPVSALRARTVSLASGEGLTKTSADSIEVAMAGKGFSQKAEAEYRAENPNLDYATVNMMEGYTVTREDREAFLQAGRAGGAQ